MKITLNENNTKNEDDLKNENNLKNLPSPPKFVCPHPLKNYLNSFLWPLTVTATPQPMLNRKLYQAPKPEMDFHMINMMYAALPMHA